MKQAALADTIVLTKRDLAPAAERGLRARLARLNPRAAIVAAAHGGLPAGAAPFDASAPREDLAPAADTPHRHGEGIESFVLVRERPLAGAALALLVETLAEHAGADLLRVKGLVALAEAPDRPGVLHGAQHVFHPLDFLPAWPDADRRTRLVFITRGVPRDWVERLLDAIAWEVEETSRALATGGAARPPIETTLETTSCST